MNPTGVWYGAGRQRYYISHIPARWERFALWFQGWRYVRIGEEQR